MDEQGLNRRYETIAWGTFFILLGATSLLPVPNGTGTVGIGVILLGLNLARARRHIKPSSFTIILGVIALAIGAVDVARAAFNLPMDLPFFPMLLIVIGGVWLLRGVTESRTNR